MHRFLTRHLQILRSSVLVVSLSVLSISVTNFMSDLKRALIIELIWNQSRCHGGLVHLAPQTKLPAPQIEIWNTINQWSFCQFSECQAPLHKRKAPSVKTFWTVHWNIYQSIQSYIKQTVSLLGFNTAQSWKSSLRPGCGKWSGQHNAAILVVSSTTSPTWALVDIRNNAITQMFWNEQNKLGYRHMTVMVEVAKPVIMAIAVHQSLQGS